MADKQWCTSCEMNPANGCGHPLGPKFCPYRRNSPTDFEPTIEAWSPIEEEAAARIREVTPYTELMSLHAARAAISVERERCAIEIEWLRRLLRWCRPRLKHPSYQIWLDKYLNAGPSAAPEDEPPIVKALVDD